MSKFCCIILWLFILLIDKLFFNKLIRNNPISIGFTFYSLLFFISIGFDTCDDYSGFIVIIIFYFFAFLGLFVTFNIKTRFDIGKIAILDEKSVKNVLILFLLIVSFISIYSLIRKGVSLSTLSNVDEVLEINENSAKARYGKSFKSKVEINYFNTLIGAIKSNLTYICGVVSGIYFILDLKNKKSSALPFIIFIIAIIDMCFSNGKLGVVTIAILFAVGMYLTLWQPNVNSEKLIRKTYVLLILISFVFFMLFFSFFLRLGKIDSDFIGIVFFKFINYAFGSLYAFNNWFINNYYNIPAVNLGVETLQGIPSMIGFVERKQGVYTEAVCYGIWHTNIYTSFRPLLCDFGLIGFVIFAFFFGGIIGYLLKKVLLYQLIPTIVIGMCLFFLFFSFLNSPYVYSSLTFAIPGAYLSIYMCERLKWRNSK